MSVAKRTRQELEDDNAAFERVFDAIEDVVDDDELSATRKVSAVQEELDKLDEEDETEEDDEAEEQQS